MRFGLIYLDGPTAPLPYSAMLWPNQKVATGKNGGR